MGSIPKSARIDYEQAARLYLQGLSTPQVAEAMGTSTCTVIRALRVTGTPTRSISEARSLRSRGQRRVDKNGYVLLRVGLGVRKKEHAHIAEKVLGRPLKKGEVVHHINGDPADNRHSNLLICSTSYHTWLHWKMTQKQREETNNGKSVGIDCTKPYQCRLNG